MPGGSVGGGTMGKEFEGGNGQEEEKRWHETDTATHTEGCCGLEGRKETNIHPAKSKRAN